MANLLIVYVGLTISIFFMFRGTASIHIARSWMGVDEYLMNQTMQVTASYGAVFNENLVVKVLNDHFSNLDKFVGKDHYAYVVEFSEFARGKLYPHRVDLKFTYDSLYETRFLTKAFQIVEGDHNAG